MPEYEYTVKTKDARTVKSKEKSLSKDKLVADLRSRGLFIISIKEISKKVRGPSVTAAQVQGKRNSLKLYDLALFARNLATTLSSGVTLLRSLEIIAYQTESLKLSKVLNDCRKGIKSGLSFGESIEKHPDVFSRLWMGIVQVGETSGNLPLVLDKLADFLEMRIEFERKIKSAMVYPAILMAAAIIAVGVFLKVIFPKFSVLFNQFNIELPWATKVMLNASDVFEKNFFLILGGVGLIVFLVVTTRKRPEVKAMVDSYSLKLPIINKFTTLTLLERLTSTIHILLESGLPLVYTLEVSAHSVGNVVFEEKLLAVAHRVRDGNPLSEEFSRQGIFPLLVSEMAKIGEETGSMPEVFSKISSHYRKELATRIERAITAFEPIMIVFMGIVIGGVVISLFLPLFRIATING